MGFDLPVMNRLRRSGRALSPASLFATGAQGVIYDPRDLSTMFQDSLGTTPVTAPGQPVGLRLDKSGRDNHATQATAGARLTYGIEPKTGTRNVLTHSEDFANAAWAKLASGTAALPAVTANYGIAPDGTTTADRIIFDRGAGTTAGDLSRIVQDPVDPATGTPTSSFYVRSTDGVSTYTMRLLNGFTESNITVTGTWQRFSLTSSSTTFNCQLGLMGNVNQQTADVLVWGAQGDYASSPTPYQKVVTAFEVTEAGVPTCHYCAYAGANSMATGSIDFTATDKMSFFAGIRKSSDATLGVLLEASATKNSNNGIFALFAPNANGSSDFTFYSKGTIPAAGSAAIALGFAAPVTKVVTGLGDIAGDLVTTRINGTQQSQATVDQGTGNYGNHILYFGRRAGSTLPFTGRDYGIVIVGKATSAAEINITEAWLAANTPTVVL